jgi:hypothetical protein
VDSVCEETGRKEDKERRTVTHGEGSGTGTGLGLNDFITTELDSLDEVLVCLAGDTLGDFGLGEERDDGDTGVTTAVVMKRRIV